MTLVFPPDLTFYNPITSCKVPPVFTSASSATAGSLARNRCSVNVGGTELKNTVLCYSQQQTHWFAQESFPQDVGFLLSNSPVGSHISYSKEG